MPSSRAAATKRARRVWQLMFDFFISTAPQRTGVLGRWNLTPNDSRALNSLDPETGRAMRSLADEWQCDASNATWIIDRLEGAGLAQRRSAPEDRRVKLVVLTAKGVRVKREVMDAFYQPPPELLSLDAADLALLERVMTRLIGGRVDEA